MGRQIEFVHVEEDIPRHLGGRNAYDSLLPVTPWDHAVIDKYRHFNP